MRGIEQMYWEKLNVNGKTYIRQAISWQTRRPITARSATTTPSY
jgi:hypothetical protein